MKSQNHELRKLVEYTAKRILDQLLNSKSVVKHKEQFSAVEIFKTMTEGPTREIIFNNLETFDHELNQLIHNRIDYLCAEGVLVFDFLKGYRIPTEKEIEEFLNVD